MMKPDKGSGSFMVPPERLTEALAMLPTAFEVRGSLDCKAFVRLLVVSDQLVGHGHKLQLHIKDKGCTREAWIAPEI